MWTFSTKCKTASHLNKTRTYRPTITDRDIVSKLSTSSSTVSLCHAFWTANTGTECTRSCQMTCTPLRAHVHALFLVMGSTLPTSNWEHRMTCIQPQNWPLASKVMVSQPGHTSIHRPLCWGWGSLGGRSLHSSSPALWGTLKKSLDVFWRLSLLNNGFKWGPMTMSWRWMSSSPPTAFTLFRNAIQMSGGSRASSPDTSG